MERKILSEEINHEQMRSRVKDVIAGNVNTVYECGTSNFNWYKDA